MYDEGKEAREQRVRSHSMRLAILALLAKDGRELTAAQIRAELPGGSSLRNVHHHLRTLKDCHLVVEAGGSYKLA